MPPLSSTDRHILDFLTHLNLSSDQALLYLTLAKRGPLTKLELSRHSKINRTRVYRLVDSLKHQGLIEEITDEHRKLVAAVPVDRLEHLIKAQAQQVADLKASFTSIKQLLSDFTHTSQPGTKVMFYRGQSGIKQMVYNVLRAQDGIVGYTFRDLAGIVGQKFAHTIYSEIVANRITIRDIYSDEYLQSVSGVKNVLKPYPLLADWQKLVKSRYLPPSKLDVQVQMDIYNDVTSFYHWHENEVFGVEIYNQKVAKFQKQIFKLLWSQATPEADLPQKLSSQK